MLVRNDQSIYTSYAREWWSGRHRWLRTLQNLVPARLRMFDERVGTWSGKTVLDLGCGGGFMAEAMASRGARVIGVDPAEAAVDIARKHAERAGLSIDYRVGTGERLPVDSQSLDCVVCVDVLEHVSDVEAVLGEVARVLKPGGLFLFDTINRNRIAGFLVIFLGERVLGILRRGTHDPTKFIKPTELAATLERTGFRGTRLTGLGPRGLDRRLDLTFGPLPTTLVMYLGHATRSVQAFSERSERNLAKSWPIMGSTIQGQQL